MSNAITLGFTITVGGTSYHSITDLGLALHNTNYIGEPEVDTSFISFPTTSGFYDISELLTPDPVYKQRTIKLEVGTTDAVANWDSKMSTIWNTFHGRQATIIFDNDLTNYWQGRIMIQNYQRVKTLGTFDIVMITQPFKFAVTPTIDTYTATGDISLPTSAFALIPQFYIEFSSPSDYAKIEFDDIWGVYHWREYDETETEYWFTPPFFNSKCTNASITLTGATFKIRWRAKSL